MLSTPSPRKIGNPGRPLEYANVSGRARAMTLTPFSFGYPLPLSPLSRPTTLILPFDHASVIEPSLPLAHLPFFDQASEKARTAKR